MQQTILILNTLPCHTVTVQQEFA